MSTSRYDKIILEELVLSMSIGINDAEKVRLQNVCVNLALEVIRSNVKEQKTIKDVLCYQKLTESIRALSKSRHFDLVENFAEDICSLCFKDPRVVTATTGVFKTQIMKDVKKIGVEIHRERS